MDFTRGTRPEARGQTRPPVYDNYQPSVEWSQDAENHLLRVYLPDFKREELKVQLDNSGKLTVKGTRQVGERRYMRLDQAFEVPKDTIVEKISGKFEEGCLFLTLPKKIKGEAPAPSQEKRDELSQREKPKSAEVEKKTEEEPTKKEKPKSSEGEMKKEEKPTMKDKPKVSEVGKKKEEEDTQKDKPKGSEDEMKKDEKPREVEKPKSGEDEKRKEEETTHKEKPRSSEEKKEEEPIYTHKPKHGEENKEREATQREKREKGEEKKKEESWYKSMAEDDYNMEKARKKAAARKKCGKDEDGWLSYGLVDDLLEKINRKKYVIAVAVVAFSIGFYVSRKLKSS